MGIMKTGTPSNTVLKTLLHDFAARLIGTNIKSDIVVASAVVGVTSNNGSTIIDLAYCKHSSLLSE